MHIELPQSLKILFALLSSTPIFPPSDLFPTPIPLQQSRLPHQLPKRPPTFQQPLRRIKLLNPPGLKHNNTITIQNSVDTMRDGNDSAFTEKRGPEGGLEQGVGLDVDGGGGFVEDEDVGRGEEGAS